MHLSLTVEVKVMCDDNATLRVAVTSDDVCSSSSATIMTITSQQSLLAFIALIELAVAKQSFISALLSNNTHPLLLSRA